jgi:hypothetical protein
MAAVGTFGGFVAGEPRRQHFGKECVQLRQAELVGLQCLALQKTGFANWRTPEKMPVKCGEELRVRSH